MNFLLKIGWGNLQTEQNDDVIFTVGMYGIAPPVPAAHWVVDDGDRLRVEYDDVVQFSDGVVAGVSSEHVLQ